MTDTDDERERVRPGTKPGIWTLEVQRAAALAIAARRVKAEPGNLFSLSNYRLAREAAVFLSHTLKSAWWMRCVHAGYSTDHTPVLVIVARHPPAEMDRLCTASAVNDIGVEIRVGGCSRRRCPASSPICMAKQLEKP